MRTIGVWVTVAIAVGSAACAGTDGGPDAPAAAPGSSEASAGLDLAASPGVAGWALDGTPRTDALPASLRGLAPGRHVVELDAGPGFTDQHVVFTAAPGSVVDIRAVLERKGATSSVTTTVTGGASYVVTDTDVEVLDIVRFAPHSAVMAESAHGILDAVAATLLGNPEIQVVEVQSHTAEPGGAAGNLRLSQQRAAAVVRYLVGKGVAPRRLVAQGYGSSEPLVAASDPAARAKNDRIAFVIVRRDTSR